MAGLYPLQLSSVSDKYEAIYKDSINNPKRFWSHLGNNRLNWFRPFDQVMICDVKEARMEWFIGGKINVSGSPVVC